MKTLLIVCALVMVFSVALVQAQQYEVSTPAGGAKNFTTAEGVPPNASISFDIYLTALAAPQNSGGAFVDFSGSTGDLAYVSAGRCMVAGTVDEGCVGNWSNGVGALVHPAAGPGTILIQVGNLGGAAPDGDGDIIVGTFQVLNTGPADATVNITTIPSLQTWQPLEDATVGAGQVVISQVCDCQSADECPDDGLFCTGVPTCADCVCGYSGNPCDDGNRCTLDCDEDADACNPADSVCDTAVLTGPLDACCDELPCSETDVCGAEITLIKQSGIYQPPTGDQVVTVKNKICLNNPDKLVGGIQFDICDSPDCLTCIDCELTERTVMFDCFVLELPNGCCRVIMICKNPGCAINPGECDIVTVVMQTNGNPECGQDCIIEEITGIVASDYDGFALAGSGVPGLLCPVVCGDVCPPGSGTANDCGDGVVDIYDIMCEVDLALTATTPNNCQLARADVPTGTPPNCFAPDGAINILDIMVLIDMALHRQDCCSFYTGVIYFSGSSGCGSGSGFTTGERTIMSNGIERVYYLELPKDYNSNTAYSLVFGFHGLGGDYTSFTEGSSYNLQSAMGEEAILVYPNALPDDSDVPKWVDSDLDFFDDLYAELEENLCFDIRKVFALGHSAGAGFTHELGCQKGDILRGIGPVAGALTSDYSECIGQVAVIQIHGANDTVVPLGLILPTRDYWIAINSCKKEETSEGVDTSCDAYGSCDTNFTVQYCEHSGGHEWPAFASEGIWDFFSSLPEVAPSNEKGTGDVENLGKGIANFKINYPLDFVGVPEKLALALYPYGTSPPVYVAPSYILNFDVPLGVINIGEITEYSNVETTMSGVVYGNYTFTVIVYVEGSGYPIPTTGVDYQGFQDITIGSDTITLDTPIELDFVDSF